MMLFAAAVTVNNGLQTNLIDLVLQSGLTVKFVLFLLLIGSVLCWTVIFFKYKMFKSATKESQAFLNAFWYGKDLEEIYIKSESFKNSPVANVFKSGFKELKKFSEERDLLKEEGIANVSRALSRSAMVEVNHLESAVGILATVASAAPFVGLFGTVWGIMNSFQGIGATGNANLAVVAPGISEALIATAAGLACAIPAVIAYNHFIQRIKLLATEMETFTHDFLNLIQRSVLKAK